MKYFFDISNHTQIEETEQVSRIIGLIAYKLSKVNLLEDYKQEFKDFFDEICIHEELNI